MNYYGKLIVHQVGIGSVNAGLGKTYFSNFSDTLTPSDSVSYVHGLAYYVSLLDSITLTDSVVPLWIGWKKIVKATSTWTKDAKGQIIKYVINQ